MKSHQNSKSMVMASPRTKLITLNAEFSKPKAIQRQKLPRECLKSREKESLLLKLISNQSPSFEEFLPSNIASNSPFRLPTKIRQRKKVISYDFNNILGSNQTKQTSDSLEFWKKNGFDQVHYIKKCKSKMSRRVKTQHDESDSALIISKKKILPAIVSHNQILYHGA
jgi:hypothetical protein